LNTLLTDKQNKAQLKNIDNIVKKLPSTAPSLELGSKVLSTNTSISSSPNPMSTVKQMRIGV
jgi:hypothetical protein